MTRQTPPEWGSDSFGEFFREAEYNDRGAAANFPDVFAFLRSVHALYESVESAIGHCHDQYLLIPHFLVIRTHSAFLASVRLAMSGQSTESYAVLRCAIEQAWYALHMAKDPKPPSRTETWIKRHDSQENVRACKTEFRIGNVKASHEAIDPQAAAQLQVLYDHTINLGAHPNERALFQAMRTVDDGAQTEFQVGILMPEQVFLVGALRIAAAVAIGVLKITEKIFPEEAAEVGMTEAIEVLIHTLNSIFSKYALPDPAV